MYVINDCTLANVDTMLNKNIINCFEEEDLSAVDHNIIDNMVEKAKVVEQAKAVKPVFKIMKSYTKNIYKFKS